MGLSARAALALTTALACAGCVEDLRATLVPLFGCGIEGEIDSLELTARGDFSPADAPPVFLNDGSPMGGLSDLPDSVQGVTVESSIPPGAVGRTARLHDEGELPVYFSPRDRLCRVESDIAINDAQGTMTMAVGDRGDVVVVGGVDATGELSREILHYRDIEGELRRGVGQLPWGSRGHTVHALGGQRFIAVGGTTATDEVLARAVPFEVGERESDVVVAAAIDLETAGAPDPARAFHAGVELDDGRVLVAGGCVATINGECAEAFDGEIGSAFFLERSGSDIRVDDNVPPLTFARFGHRMLVSRDGIVFVVGGFEYVNDIDGSPRKVGVPTIELLLPGLASWAPYGAALNELVDDDIVGATLLEGGLVVVVSRSGLVYVVDEFKKLRFQNWCGEAESVELPTPPCFLDIENQDTLPPGSPMPEEGLPRTLLTLPGERILADNFLLPVAQIGRDGTAAINISDEQAIDPLPGARADADTAVLDDGSVLIAGGRAPASDAPTEPVLLRFRPELDGPDEREPVLEGLPPGSLMVHDDKTEVIDGTLYFHPEPLSSDTVVGAWAHVRAFLSRRFRLQATIGTVGDTARPRFVFSQGAIARNTLAIDPDRVRFIVRASDGGSVEITCADRGLDFRDTQLQVVIDVSPEAVEVRHSGEAIARCPWAGDLPVAVGIGAVGAGTVTARSLGLSRG